MMDSKDKIRLLKLCRTSIYGLALLTLLGILLVQVYQCLALYVAEPTYYSSSIVQQRKAAFPALTVCPEGGGYKEDVLKEHGIAEVKNYNNKVDMTWSSNRTDVTEKELFRLATYELDEIFSQAYLRFFKADGNGKYNTYLDVTSEASDDGVVDGDAAADRSFWEQRHRGFGRCYTLHPEEDILKQGVYYMKLKLPVKIYFHAHNQFLDLSGRMGYKIYPGEVAQAQVTYEEIRLISRQDDGHLTCTHDLYDVCMYAALERHMLNAHDCVVPYIKSDADVCVDREAVNATFWIAYDRVTNQFHDCELPCETLLVTLGGKNMKEDSSSPDVGTAYFYFPQRIPLSEENYFYTFLSMMAEVGGYVGLLLGVSLFHFASWVSQMIEKKIVEIEKQEEAGGGRRGEKMRLDISPTFVVKSNKKSGRVSSG